MKKRLLVLIPLVVVLLAGAAFGGWYFVNREADGFQFAHPDFTGKYTLVVPASDSVRRNLSVHFVQDGESEAVQAGVTYTLDYRPQGVTLVGNTLTVSSEAEESHTLYVTAEYGGETARLKVKIEKDETIADVAASPVEKEGWTLVYQDEFEDEVLDYSTWTPYYLRHWTDDDERTLANYRFEDGSLVLSAESALDNWSDQDSSKAFGIMTYERDNLHKFGEPGSGAVENRSIPEFDGYATKYGYFEMRLKMPSTRDGSHFAWWMVGTQSDQHSTAILQGDEAPYYGHYSNETG
ncbi:MAG: hypothetical protein LIO46_02745, partial [Clostridiales bacterium]|nr:hypothetical protein [Clostridiales bacterium]